MTTKITEKNISNLANFAVDWQSVVTADGSTNTTAVAGKGYFINTTNAAHTIVLPASPSFGDTIIINDYASTFATNNVTINPNGNKIEASTSNGVISTNDQTHTLVYTDSTQGWKIVNQDTASTIQPTYISATGGTVTTSGNFKIHTFTGDGCFVVSSLANPLGGSNTVDYLVVAGGGGGGKNNNGDRGAGGGGAGGYREAKTGNQGCHTASPLATPTGITLTATTYPITVGAGGSGGVAPATDATSGSSSIFSTITSAGGGFGQSAGTTAPAGGSGGSGGGGSAGGSVGSLGGAGNTPPVAPPQGNNGAPYPSCGTTGPGVAGAGGGGALTAGVTSGGLGQQTGGDGGKAANTDITGSTAYYSGGGGAGGSTALGGGPGGGGGRGGDGSPVYNSLPGGGDGSGPQPSSYATLGSGVPGEAGGANTGFGGGGGAGVPSGVRNGGAGGKGVVIIRYKYQ